MTRCQHCLKFSRGIQRDGHHFCPHCGKTKRGTSLMVIDVAATRHEHWSNSLDRELAGVGISYSEVADQII